MKRVPNPCPCVFCRDRVGILIFNEAHQKSTSHPFDELRAGSVARERDKDGAPRAIVTISGLVSAGPGRNVLRARSERP